MSRYIASAVLIIGSIYLYFAFNLHIVIVLIMSILGVFLLDTPETVEDYLEAKTRYYKLRAELIEKALEKS